MMAINTDYRKEFEAMIEATNAWAKQEFKDENAEGVLPADDGSAPLMLHKVGDKYYWVKTQSTQEEVDDEEFERFAWERTADGGIGRFVGKLVDEYEEEDEEYAFEECDEPEM